MKLRHVSVLSFACLALAACSSSNSPPASEAFEGTWTYSTGSAIATCAGNVTTTQPTGTVTIAAGTASGTIVFINAASPDCTFTFNVNGNEATIEPNQTCTVTSSGETIAQTITTFTLTLANNVLTQSSASTAVLNENGSSEDCTGTTTATLTQVAK
jgi:hypothetical protein